MGKGLVNADWTLNAKMALELFKKQERWFHQDITVSVAVTQMAERVVAQPFRADDKLSGACSSTQQGSNWLPRLRQPGLPRYEMRVSKKLGDNAKALITSALK